MAREEAIILKEIEEFQPANGNWLGLDNLLQELFENKPSASSIPFLLRVFDRFPDEDGNGVFWAIVHGLESLPGYETVLETSAKRKPTEFKEIMLDRIRNAGENLD